MANIEFRTKVNIAIEYSAFLQIEMWKKILVSNDNKS